MNLRSFILTAAAGLVLTLAFPGVNLWPLAWIACVPFIMSLYGCSPCRSIQLGLVFGILFFGILIHWIRLFGYLPWVLLVLMQSLYLIPFVLAASVILRHKSAFVRIIGLASAWTAVEFIRSLGSTGFTWGDLVYSQAYNLPIARLASVTGPWGISFLIMLVNATLAEALRKKQLIIKVRTLALPVLSVIAVFAWGGTKNSQKIEKPIKVAVVQAGIPQEIYPYPGYSERHWREYTELTKEAVRLKPQFIVWPESAIHYDLATSPGVQMQMHLISKASNADVVTGGIHVTRRNGEPKEQNGAYVVTPQKGLADSYYKVRLVPFGEFVPARKWLTIAKRYGVREIDYVPGPGWNPMKTTHGKIGTVICFESIFPQISRIMADRGAEVLFILTNDGWFQRTSAAEQHLQMAILRAIENNRYVIRSTTTGISAVIAPDGSIQKSLGLWKRGVMSGEVETRSEKTPYTRYGDWFAYMAVVLTVGTALITKGKKTRKGKALSRKPEIKESPKQVPDK